MPTMRRISVLVLVLVVTTTTAWADDGTTELEKALHHPAPAPGLDRARTGPPAWCGGRHPAEQGWAYDVATGITSYVEADHNRRHDTGEEHYLINAARLVCGANHPVAQRAATEIEQLWINETGLAEADAIASLAARIDQDKFEAERTQLCDAMPMAEDNVDDKGRKREQRILGLAHRRLLGCDTAYPLWQQKSSMSYIEDYIDRGAVERDPLARLAWVVNLQFRLLDVEEKPETALLGYVTDQFDLHVVSADVVMHELDAAPYRGNRYAHVVVLESLARMRLRTSQIDVAVAKLTKDPAWKEALVTAPQRGAAAWRAAADKHKDALARSDAFDQETRGTGNVKGCEAPLRADFQAIFKKIKHDDIETIRAELSDDPLAGLLLTRLAACMALDGDAGVGQMLEWVSNGLRITTGPRMAAYYATIDALGALKKDQRPFRPNAIPQITRRDLHGESFHINTKMDGAVIARVDKKANGTRVTFVQNKFKVMSQDCQDGPKIDRILPDGHVEYRKVCHDAGLVTVDQTPRPRFVPPAFTSGLRAGRLAVFSGIDRREMSEDSDDDDQKPHRGKQHEEDKFDLPLVIYADKSTKHIVAFYGFSFE